VVCASSMLRHSLRGAVPCGYIEGVAVLGLYYGVIVTSKLGYLLEYDDVCVYQKGCRSKEERLSTDTPS
jgi:hypothetical protein